MARKNIKIYALYDTRDNDLCVFIGTVPEIAQFFGMQLAAAYHSIKQGRKFKKRYRAELIEVTGRGSGGREDQTDQG